MQRIEENEIIQCPYEKSHRIIKSRFQVHLGRCRKNHKNVAKSTCPFNTEHILNEPELDWHVSICPERLSFEKFRHRDFPTTNDSDDVSPVQNLTPHSELYSECWNDEPDAPTYNPQTYAANAPVLRMMQGAPPSVKKQFRQQERLRLLGINND